MMYIVQCTRTIVHCILYMPSFPSIVLVIMHSFLIMTVPRFHQKRNNISRGNVKNYAILVESSSDNDSTPEKYAASYKNLEEMDDVGDEVVPAAGAEDESEKEEVDVKKIVRTVVHAERCNAKIREEYKNFIGAPEREISASNSDSSLSDRLVIYILFVCIRTQNV